MSFILCGQRSSFLGGMWDWEGPLWKADRHPGYVLLCKLALHIPWGASSGGRGPQNEELASLISECQHQWVGVRLPLVKSPFRWPSNISLYLPLQLHLREALPCKLPSRRCWEAVLLPSQLLRHGELTKESPWFLPLGLGQLRSMQRARSSLEEKESQLADTDLSVPGSLRPS